MERVGEAGTLFVVLQLAFERRVAHRLVADEVDALDLDLRPLVHVERQVDELRSTARDFFDLGRDLGELEALVAHHVAHDARYLADQTGIDERVEANLRVGVLQLLVDLRDLDPLGPDVVDDLDALPLLHVVDDDLADDAVGEGVVAHVDPEVVEEVGRPQPLEVLEDDLFSAVVVRAPELLGRLADDVLELGVIEVGLEVDQRDVALRLEAEGDLPEHRSRVGGREVRRGVYLRAAHGQRRPGGRRRRLGADWGGPQQAGQENQTRQHARRPWRKSSTRPARHRVISHGGTETQRKPKNSLCLGVSVAHSPCLAARGTTRATGCSGSCRHTGTKPCTLLEIRRGGTAFGRVNLVIA